MVDPLKSPIYRLVELSEYSGGVVTLGASDREGKRIWVVTAVHGELAQELEERIRPMTAEGENDPDPYREALVRTLREITAAAEAEMLTTPTPGGAHQRAIEAKLRELEA